MAEQKSRGEPDYGEALGEIIASLTRVRGLVEAANLPDGEGRRNLITHLALASIAAHSLRVGPDDDDLIVLDE